LLKYRFAEFRAIVVVPFCRANMLQHSGWNGQAKSSCIMAIAVVMLLKGVLALRPANA